MVDIILSSDIFKSGWDLVSDDMNSEVSKHPQNLPIDTIANNKYQKHDEEAPNKNNNNTLEENRVIPPL